MIDGDAYDRKRRMECDKCFMKGETKGEVSNCDSRRRVATESGGGKLDWRVGCSGELPCAYNRIEEDSFNF